jgi:hypothetical protein
MATAGRISGLVIQALRHIGNEATDESTVKALRSKLSDEDKARLLKDIRYAPGWIADIIREIARDRRGQDSFDAGRTSIQAPTTVA